MWRVCWVMRVKIFDWWCVWWENEDFWDQWVYWVDVGFLEVTDWWVRIFEGAVVSADSRGVGCGWLSREYEAFWGQWVYWVAVGFLEVTDWWVRIFEVAVVSADSRGVGWLAESWVRIFKVTELCVRFLEVAECEWVAKWWVEIWSGEVYWGGGWWVGFLDVAEWWMRIFEMSEWWVGILVSGNFWAGWRFLKEVDEWWVVSGWEFWARLEDFWTRIFPWRIFFKDLLADFPRVSQGPGLGLGLEFG